MSHRGLLGALVSGAVLVGFVVVAPACSSQPEGNDAGVVDAGSHKDAGVDAGVTCPPDLPDASDPCLAVNPCGNERKVGRVCTKGGGECGEFDLINAWLCTVEQDPTAPAFCTRQCIDDTDCGSNAVCLGDPSDPMGTNKGCVPVACAPTPEDGGMDGGAGDGGVGDGGELDAGELDGGSSTDAGSGADAGDAG